MRPSSTSRTASGTTVPGAVPHDDGPGGEALRMVAEPSRAPARRRRPATQGPGCRRYRGPCRSSPPRSDQGGITGWLLDLVDTLGPVGVGLSILLETVIPPIPSEAVLGAAGVLINDGRMTIVPVILFATLGSMLGAIFFYYIGLALGPRRSHAFLDRLPLVETEDVDKTFAWFERHGRSAVFLGRMVPIVRSFISVPAGVVRMPFGQFLLFTAGGSLIWNTVLVSLGCRGRRLHREEPALPRLRGHRGRRPRRALVRLPQGDGEDEPPADRGRTLPADERDQA